jgi:hypothetical protein
LQTEISLCRVYKRSGIDDGRPSSSARSTPTRSATAQQDTKQAASSSSTPTPPTTPSNKLHLLHGECTSPAAITEHAPARKATSAPRQKLSATSGPAAAAVDHQHEGTGVTAAAMYEHSRNANAFASSTYSLLSLVNAASMGTSAAAAIDELSTLQVAGHGPPAYFNHHHHQAGGGHSHFLALPTAPSSQPTLPMSLAATSDKIWEWNTTTIPNAAATRDYSNAGFK